ncbi:B3 domain-containing transcription factor VRN1-like [Rhododendron vialii]|uniref:B3 domain-containing transcription factor VRN1-like n=1 Tax=Rhododendron vialii TaxID=182163 RepID=UPI00265FD6B5|nr:B3 domain-containing transcription factor VRN1-like [Rhododendron vialii]
MVSKSHRRQSGDDGSNPSSSHEVKVAPHFFKIIHSSGVPHQKLRIPLKFISQYGKNVGNHVFLKVPSGAVWKVELERSNGVVWMCNGWKEFAKYYSIGFGHLLVFRYDGNCNFNVLIFDTSASEIAYPVSATHGEQTNINCNRNSKIPVTEEVIEIDDSVETYNTKREETYGRGETEKLGVRTRQKTRKAAYYRGNIEKNVSVKISDDSLVRDSSVSERERAHAKFGMENNSNKQEFPLNFKSKGLKLPNQKKDAKTEIETEQCTGGTYIGERRYQSQIAVQMLSATANINSRALERARYFKSKKPFFMVRLQPSYVSCNYSMNVPLKFLKKYLRDNQKNISLRISDGTTWLVRFYAGALNGKRNLGWGPFVRDNNLKVGDICVFELISTGIEPQLDVTIFRK